ncbi:MAG: DUF3006 domain-containing protein [Spirochaetia bacterium]
MNTTEKADRNHKSIRVDSISSGTARIEDDSGRLFDIPSSWLPHETSEGDILNLQVHSDCGTHSRLEFTRDESAAEARRSRIKNKLDTLRNQGEK